MKNNIFMSILLLIILISSCTKQKPDTVNRNDSLFISDDTNIESQDDASAFQINSEQFVITTNGLNLRTEPSLSSEIIKTLPFGNKVLIISKSNEMLTIDDTSSYWYQVQSDNNIGWVFGAYLDDNVPFLVNSDGYIVLGNSIELRREPDISSEIIKLLSFLSRVTISNISKEKEIINGINTYWYEVKSNDDIGWIHGSYLASKSDKSDLLIGYWQSEMNYYSFSQDGSFRGGRRGSGYVESGKWFLSDNNKLYFYGWGGWPDEMDLENITYKLIINNVYFIDENSFSFQEFPDEDRIYARTPL